MRITQIVFALALLFSSIGAIAQSEMEAYVSEGIRYHDQGDYNEAIKMYQKALDIDPESGLVNYEMGLSYFSKGDYKKAIKYADVILNQNEDYMVQAYITKGSALDVLGKTNESIKLFEKAIAETEGSYLLYYNLALNYYKLNDLDKAEANVINAIEINSNHASSHLMLANIQNAKGHKVQTLLATYYFLFLEPGSKRSITANELLQENFGANVFKDSNEPNIINISVSPNSDSEFGAAELMISMLEASKSIEENERKSDDEMFLENTASFFNIMGELKKEENKEIWWTFYTTFFYNLAKSDHLETYCKYITQSVNENSEAWLKENPNKLKEFNDRRYSE